MLACPPDEQHDTGLRMLADLLTAHGYEASLLGASTPIDALIDFVSRTKPTAVGLSIAAPQAIPGLADAVRALREHDPALRILLGGRCIDLYPAVAGAVQAEAFPTFRDTLAVLDAA